MVCLDSLNYFSFCFLLGANGLANPFDFKTPTSSFENRKCSFQVTHKFLGSLWNAKYDHSIFNVVGWRGNYVPYKYNLLKFACVNSVSYDHMVCGPLWFLVFFVFCIFRIHQYSLF